MFEPKPIDVAAKLGEFKAKDKRKKINMTLAGVSALALVAGLTAVVTQTEIPVMIGNYVSSLPESQRNIYGIQIGGQRYDIELPK